ncbi:MAG: creatininase family protein [Gaiellales bacterium]
MTRVRLGELTRSEARLRAEAGALCVIPVGALEQHGEHLPLATDTLLVEEVCARAAPRAAGDVILAPTVWAGQSPHHVRLGVTVSLEPALLIAQLGAIVGELRRWFVRVAVVNGHGGNRGWLAAFALEHRCPAVSYWELVDPDTLRELVPADRGSPGHAGQMETSAMLAALPALVGMAATAFEPIAQESDALLYPEMGESGVLGDPGAATAELGERLLDAAANGVAAFFTSVPPIERTFSP